MKVLEASPNPFGGMVVAPDLLPDDPTAFQEQLAHSLDVWREEGYKVVWLEIPIAKAALIPIATDAGFTFHHSLEDYLLLTHCLVEGSFIPPFATHYTGAGGVVINDKNELLVVSEKHRRSKNPSYKLPGGALHPGEHIAECVTREIREETGVQTVFQSLVCFRHWHGYRYNKSDIYFVCRLSPLSQDVTKQDEEIEECLWMPVQDYLDSEFVSVFNKHIVKAALESPGVAPMEIQGYSDPDKHEIFMPAGMEHL
ncbi:MAG: NUDIX domain-containing protein [bacterium]|nr:NUDIX domain-containing protein [bacterium]